MSTTRRRSVAAVTTGRAQISRSILGHGGIGLSGGICSAQCEFFFRRNFNNAHTAIARTRGEASVTRASAIAEVAVAGIANGHEHIAHKAIASDTFDGRALEQLAEFCVVQIGEFSEKRTHKFCARVKCGFSRVNGKLVPWAHREAIVAAIDAVAN